MSHFKKLCKGFGAYIHLWFLFYKTKRWLQLELTPMKRLLIELQYRMIVTSFVALKKKYARLPIPKECVDANTDIKEAYEKIDKQQLAVEAIREQQSIQQQKGHK